MWSEPYLETCCRAALHRLALMADDGRPGGLKDGPCLDRLVAMGFAEPAAEDRYRITRAGSLRHRSEILRERAADPVG